MKNKKIYLIVALVATLVFVLGLLCGDAFAVSTLAGTSLAAAMVGVPITDTPTSATVDEKTDINREDISTTVTEMMPSRTPLDTIMRNIGKSQKVENQRIGYYQASYKPVRDVLDSSAMGNGASAAAPASSNTLSAPGLAKIFVQVQNPDIWRVHDTLLMFNLSLPGIKGGSVVGAAGSHTDNIMFYVLGKSGSVLELLPIGGVKGSGASEGKFVVPTFDASVTIVRMGQAKSELAISTSPFALYPELSHQYCQNFMAQIEESTFQKMSKKDISWGFSNFEAINILSMKMEMELSMLFGMGGEYTAGNDRTFFTRGITRDIERTLDYGTGGADRSITKEQYTGWLKEVFDGNNGSDRRVLFAGSGLIRSLSCVDEFQRNLSGVEKDTTLGIDVRKIQTYFGTLDIIHAPLFRDAGWEDCGLVLDLAHITKHEFLPMSVTNLDLKSSGQKNADARVLQEVSALTLKYPDCHAIIKPKN